MIYAHLVASHHHGRHNSALRLVIHHSVASFRCTSSTAMLLTPNQIAPLYIITVSAELLAGKGKELLELTAKLTDAQRQLDRAKGRSARPGGQGDRLLHTG